MHKKILLAALGCVVITMASRADERLLYYSGFNEGWTTTGSNYDAAPVTQVTDFSNEEFTFSFENVRIVTDGTTVKENTKNPVPDMTVGYLMSNKSEATITLSALQSITRIVYNHAATGDDRGWGMKVSVDGGASWDVVYNTLIVGNARAGVKVEVDVTAKLAELGKQAGDAGVMLQFYNMNTASNAYMADLWIYGEYVSTEPQVSLTTALNIEGAGVITVTPPADSYDINMTVNLMAEANFGYEFANWTDAATGEELSTEASFDLLLDADKSVIANFEMLDLYQITVNTTSRNGKYTISPEPDNGYLPVGTEVTLTAIDTRVATFTGWEDGTTEKVRKLTIAGDTEVTANFVEEDFIVGWDFDPEPADRNGQAAYYYSAAANRGMFRMYLADGTNRAWLNNQRLGKRCVLKWATDIAGDNRYFEATFSTKDYENVKVESAMLMGSYSYYETQTMQYSVDGVEFHDLASVSYGTAEAWYPLNAELPAECNDKETVWIRWISSGNILGSGNDGTGITDVYVFADPIVVYDPVAPAVIATTPAQGSNTASASGTITFTFDKKIVLADGEFPVLLNGETLTPRVVSNSLVFNYSGLDYDTPYTVTLPAGMIVNTSGVATAEDIVLNFTTMSRPVPDKHVFHAIVDGSLAATVPATDEAIGQYKTIWEAIEAAPADRTEPWLIFIKNGYYNDPNGDPKVIAEMNQTNKEFYYTDAASNQTATTATSTPGNILYVYKPYIHLIGQDRDGVVIAQDRVSGGDADAPEKHWYDVSNSATLVVMANDFYAENLTIDNEWWTVNREEGPQALALYVEGDRVTFNNCNIRSYQDTYLSPKTRNRNVGNTAAAGSAVYHYRDRNFFNNCMIEGAVDFIYGGGDVYFDGCTINVVRKSGGYIVAPGHYDDLTDLTGETNCTRWGYVFKNTLITAPGNPLETQVWFGRPWNNSPVTVFIDTECHVNTYEGLWYERMGGIPRLWAVYNMWNADGEPMNTESRATYYDRDGNEYNTTKNFLTDEEAAQYTIENVLSGDGSDHPAVGKWNPLPVIEKAATPAMLEHYFVDNRMHIEWEDDQYAICYVVKIGGQVVGITTDNSFELTYTVPAAPVYGVAAADADPNELSVQSVNEYGALSDAATTQISWPTAVERHEVTGISVFAAGNTVYVRGVGENTDITVYDMSGRVVRSISCDRNVSFYMPDGNYIVKAADRVVKVNVR